MVGRRLRVRGAAAGRTRVGNARKMVAAERRQAQVGLWRRHLSAPARRKYARAFVDANGTGPIRLSSDSQRVDLNRRLLYAAQGPQDALPADLPLRLSPLQRRRVVASRGLWACRRTTGRRSHSRRARNRGRDRRTRSPALRPQEERLLVRLAALDRRNTRGRAIPE